MRSSSGLIELPESGDDLAGEPSTDGVTLVVGARDMPTDGVRDFAERLVLAIRPELDASVLEIAWATDGWKRALTSIPPLRGVALIQYTHLAWSRRGFPIGALRAALALRRAGARVGVVFHDPSPFTGSRVRDRLRARVQRAVVRRLARHADVAFSTLEPGHVPVLEGIEPAPRFLPAGSNIPIVPRTTVDHGFTISVFCLTERHRDEAAAIAEIISRARARAPEVALQVFGRGAMDAEGILRSALGNEGLTVEGLLDATEIAQRLAGSGALLFVRGEASSRRGTIIAAICNGLPVVASEGAETGPAIRGAGVALFSRGDHAAAADQLIRLHDDSAYRRQQRDRQREACSATFSWSAIASTVEEALGHR